MNQPKHPVSLNVFDQINTICRDFRKQCKQENQPRIEDFLSGVDSQAQSSLFRNLLHIDIEYRRRINHQPTSEEYIERFPDFARIIREAFFQSTRMSLEAMQNTPVADRTESFDSFEYNIRGQSTIDGPAASRLGDYLLLGELGRGGFGVVYEAQHTQRQNHVALKTLPTSDQRHALDDAERLHKFRREFRSLADMNHPNLVGMQTLEVDGNQWFFTMDLVDGIDFMSYVRPKNVLDEKRLRSVLPQLANAIMALHGQNIIHRDLKPSNVLVDANGKVIVLDFGLVVELAQRTDQTLSLQSSQFAGTPLYAAPEQVKGKTTSASDWYALGVMLFEAISGKPPFMGTAAEMFGMKQYEDPPKLDGQAGLPADLAELTDQLLFRDPLQRPDALEIAKSLSLEIKSQSAASIDEKSADAVNARGEMLIGRDQQLVELEDLQRQLLADRKPLSAFITGRSGEGKTSLAEQFLSPLRLATKVLVLSGRCYERESVPFKAIDGIIDSLVSFLRGQDDQQVRQMLPDDTRMLAHLFPVMGRVDAISRLAKKPVGQLDSKQIRHRAFSALRDLLRNFSNTTPIVMFIDDLQWGDADSARVLFQMLNAGDAPSMLFLGSYRRDEADESPFLLEWEKLISGADSEVHQPNIVVGPLDRQQCVKLMVMRFGDNEMVHRCASELHISTGGNPYFLDQLIDCFDPQTGSFSAIPLGEVIENKLANLPEDAAPLLHVIAVSGQAMAIDEVSKAAGLGTPSFGTITHMSTERLVRFIGSETQQIVDTYHDKIRETVLDQVSETDRCDLHLRIGEMIEASEDICGDQLFQSLGNEAAEPINTPARVFDLAYHFDSAGNQTKAMAYSLLAAEQAKGQYALDIARENYRTAEKNLAEPNWIIEFRIKIGEGETLLQSGLYDEATDALDAAFERADHQRQRLMIKAYQAAILFYSKSVSGSIRVCEEILRELGIRVPQSDRGFMIGSIRESIVHSVRRIIPDRFFRIPTAPDWKTIIAIRVLNQLFYAYINRSPVPAVWSNLVAYNRASPFKELPEMSDCLTNRGVCRVCVSGRGESGLNDFDDALRIANQFDDVTRKANTVFWQQVSRAANGRFEEAVQGNATANDLYRKISDAYRLTFVNTFFAYFHQPLGNISQVVHYGRIAFEQAIRYGQSRQAQFVLSPWARATSGKLPFAELKSCIIQSPDHILSRIMSSIGESVWHRRCGRLDEALDVADTACSLFESYRFKFAYTIAAFPNLAQSLRVLADAIESSDPVRCAQLRKRGLRVARRGVQLSKRIRYDLSYSLREYSLMLAAHGKTNQALKNARQSCRVASEQNAQVQYAQSLLVTGQLAEKLGLPESKEQIEEAQAKLAEFDKQIDQANATAAGKHG